MGTAHALINEEFLISLKEKMSKDDLVIVLDSDHDGAGMHLVKFYSDQLPPGYNGMMDIVLDENGVKFKKDIDV